MKRLLAIFVALFVIGCGGEEQEKPCNFQAGDYEITSIVKKTDCPDIFGEPDGEPHNNGVVWTFKEDSLKCGETKIDNWSREGISGVCYCSLNYYDTYYSITDNSFLMDRKISLVCVPAYDDADDFCNRKCSAEGLVEGNRVEEEIVE